VAVAVDDGKATMKLEIEKSHLGQPPKSGDADSATMPPRTVTTSCQTTVIAAKGEMAVLSGLHTKSNEGSSQTLVFVTPTWQDR
jgi:hypothetical protein